jgi:hypothetical protein
MSPIARCQKVRVCLLPPKINGNSVYSLDNGIHLLLAEPPTPTAAMARVACRATNTADNGNGPPPTGFRNLRRALRPPKINGSSISLPQTVAVVADRSMLNGCALFGRSRKLTISARGCCERTVTVKWLQCHPPMVMHSSRPCTRLSSSAATVSSLLGQFHSKQ